MSRHRPTALAALALAALLAGPRAGAAPIPKGAVARLGSDRLRSASPITHLAFSPNGKTLATCGQRGEVVLWSAATGAPLRRLPVRTFLLAWVHFSADGAILAVAGGNQMRFLDVATGREQRTLHLDHLAPNAPLALAPDGRHLVAGGQYGREVQLWDVREGAVRQSYPAPRGLSSHPCFTPDGKHFLAVLSDNKIHVFETATGKDLRSFDPPTDNLRRPGLGSRVRALALAPDGKLLALGLQGQGLVLQELATGRVMARLPATPGPAYGQTLAFTPNGRFLLEALAEGSVRVLGVASGREIHRLKGGARFPTTLAVSSDGKHVAIAGRANTVGLWELSTGQALHVEGGHEAEVVSLAFLGGGTRLVSTDQQGTLCLWDATGERELDRRKEPFGPFPTLGVTDGGAVRLLGVNNVVYDWRPGGQAAPQRLPGPGAAGSIRAVLSPDGKTLAAVGRDRRLRVLDVEGQQPRWTLAGSRSEHILRTIFSPDGRLLAATGVAGQVRFWRVATGRELPPLRTDRRFVSLLGFSADGRAVVFFDGVLRVCELASGRDLFLVPERTTPPRCLACSPDGRLLALGNRDGVVAVYDTVRGREVFRGDGGQGEVTALAFNGDGTLLASGGTNTTILVWRMPAPERPTGRPDREALWRDLAGLDARRAHAARLALAAAPAEAVSLLKERLKPPPGADPKQLARLVADLDNDSFAVREKAGRDLLAIGGQAETVLRERLAGAPSVELRRRAEEVLARLETEGKLGERLRCLRAVAVLEQVGTPEAVALLRQLERTNPEPLLAEEIKDGLRRLTPRR